MDNHPGGGEGSIVSPDRFVEAQAVLIPVLCPAEALNSGSRQWAIGNYKEGSTEGGGDEEKVV